MTKFNKILFDQIFCLNTAIKRTLSKKKGKCFAIFIDFERAFPNVPHKKLWNKLFEIGLSGKIIRLMKHLYDSSSTRIRLEHGNTENIDISIGLAQGEVLSPLFFSLYIADIEKILRNSGISGVKVSKQLDLQILLFADDMVVLAESEQQLQRKLNILREYFLSLDLKVNMSKTKVIVFRKGGRLKAGIQFWYGKERVDIVTEYTYLGVIFSQKGVFQKAAESFKKKGVVALASVWNTGFRGKITDWNSKIRLFESISLSCALYASQIWGLRYMDKMEELQMYFFKRLLGVERTVPGYLVRLETASPPFSLRVIKQAIKYWIKLMLMEEERYPRLCLEAMYKEWSDGNYNSTYNWVAQLHLCLQRLGFANFCKMDNIADMYAEIPHILTRIIDMKRQEDISAMHNSKRHSHYIKMWDDEMQPTKYLLLHLPQKHLNIIAQLRLNDGRIVHEKFRHSFDSDTLCGHCNIREEETVQHFLCKCRVFITRDELTGQFDTKNDDWPNLLNPSNREKCILLSEYAQIKLRLRKMMLEM